MARPEPTPEENLRLLRRIEENRAFLLLAYQSDPELLKLADPQIKRLFGGEGAAGATSDKQPSSYK